MIRLLNRVGLRVDDRRFASCNSDATGGAQCPIGRALPAQRALKQYGGLDEFAGAREACGFANDVLFQHRRHRVLSARAVLTAGLACKAPSTETEAMVARASSGVTSWAILARPRTLMCSISPARRAA